MHPYYFIIEMPDHTYDDSEGERLPSDGAAKDYGRRLVRETERERLGAMVLTASVVGLFSITIGPF